MKAGKRKLSILKKYWFEILITIKFLALKPPIRRKLLGQIFTAINDIVCFFDHFASTQLTIYFLAYDFLNSHSTV